MKRFLIATCALGAAQLATATDAHARLGVTYALGTEISTKGDYVSPFHFMPSLDWKQDRLLFQVHVGELIAGLSSGDEDLGTASTFALGTNVYYRTSKKKLTDKINGVVMPGASLDIVKGLGDLEEDGTFDGTHLALTGQWRWGAQIVGGMGFGIYVTPALGVGSVAVLDLGNSGGGGAGSGAGAGGGGGTPEYNGELRLITGGSLQFSVWDAK